MSVAPAAEPAVLEINPRCTRCALHESARSVCISGRGTANATFLFVGQAPGQQEDVRAKAFIGPAGQVLTQAINAFNLKPAWVTNAARCFPPGDRDPKPDEIEACRPYLDGEIERVNPKIIVALGNVALHALTGRTGITSLAGRVAGKYNGIPVFAMLHPSFVLRYSENAARFESACRELRWTLFPEERPGKVETMRYEPAEAVDAALKMEGPVAFDFETTGKFASDGGRMRSYAFSDGQTSVWTSCEDGTDWREPLRTFLESDIPKAAHNCSFELRWSLDLFGIEPKRLSYDTMVMHFLLNENTSHALDSVAAEVLAAPGWDIYWRLLDHGLDWDTFPMEELGPYNAIDCYWNAKLARALAAKMPPELRALYRGIALPMAKLCGRFEYRGIALDTKWAAAVDALYKRRQGGVEVDIRKEAPVRKLEESLLAQGKALNLNSNAQMGKLFYDIMRLPVGKRDRTEGGKPSVREAVMKKFEDKPAVAKYLKWKEKSTLRNNFLQKFPKFCDAKGLIHAGFNSARVVTGRLAVTNPPAQAVPEDELVRGVFVSRFPGGKLASLDFMQLEMRLVASEANETRMLEAFEKGEDVHSVTATLMFGPNFTKRQRSIAKRVGFGCVYGVSAYTLAAEFNLSADEAERMLQSFHRAYPGIYTWMGKQHAAVVRDGEITSRFGRVRRLHEIKFADQRGKERILRQAGNFPIASQGADLTNLACVLVDKKLRQEKYRSMLVHQVHDSLIVDVHPEEVAVVPELARLEMTDGVQKHAPWLRLKLAADVTVGDRWGGAVEVPKE